MAIHSPVIIAQRLKRLSSIEWKLALHEHMKLSQMQDIGGCRAIMTTVTHVDELIKNYNKSVQKNPHTAIRPQLIAVDDYITTPKKDGYRGYHLIYKYRTDSPKYACYNNLRIEIQVRSPLQHAWATAVETISTFTGQALKSNIGEQEWKRFFALMGSAIALREKRPLVRDTPTDKLALANELSHTVMQLNVMAQLKAWGAALQNTGQPQHSNSAAYLLQLDPQAMTLEITGYDADQMGLANDAYLTAERKLESIPGGQAVLVSTDTMDALRKAYPNYFLDTTAFLEAVEAAIAPSKKRS